MILCLFLFLGGALGVLIIKAEVEGTPSIWDLPALSGQFHYQPQASPITGSLGNDITNLAWRMEAP